VLALSACSSGPSSRIDYKEAKSLPTLEMPPDLTRPVERDIARLPQGAVGDGSSILPLVEGVRIERDGSRRWLVVARPAEQLWPQLREFWPSIGLQLSRDEMAIGIMETEWAENRADVPAGFLTGAIRRVFPNAYAAGTRDKYRLRVERREDGGTEIFVSHYGLQEVVASRSADIVETTWNVRPSDPELAHEIINRLVLHMGYDQQQAHQVMSAEVDVSPASRTRLVADTLFVSEGLSRTWRRTGIALDEAGLIVQDRNFSAGIYYVTDFDALSDAPASRGWMRSLFSRSGDADEKRSWQIVLSGDEQATRIVARDGEGGVLSQDEAQAILGKLAELLR
jgi:outer membrane protein assembly factor BamC